VEEVFGEGVPGNLAVGGGIATVMGMKGDFRRGIRQVGGGDLGLHASGRNADACEKDDGQNPRLVRGGSCWISFTGSDHSVGLDAVFDFREAGDFAGAGDSRPWERGL